jgi:hypothetical protein
MQLYLNDPKVFLIGAVGGILRYSAAIRFVSGWPRGSVRAFVSQKYIGPSRQLGTARMNLLANATSPKLRNMINDLYRPDPLGKQVGNGSTADAIRFERETGILLSKSGHFAKGYQYITGLERLIGSGQLAGKDLEIAKEIVADLKDALK